MPTIADAVGGEGREGGREGGREKRGVIKERKYIAFRLSCTSIFTQVCSIDNGIITFSAIPPRTPFHWGRSS